MKHLIRIVAVCLLLTLVGCPLSSSSTSTVEVSQSTGEPEPLDQLVQRTLEANLRGRTLATDTHGAWQILHGILAYGDQFTIETPDGTQPAIEYMLAGGKVDGFFPMRGNRLGQPERFGLRMEMQPTTKIGQGHHDQWLAVLAQSGLSMESEIQSPAGTFTVADWVRQTEYDITRNLENEFSWTLIALTAFRETSHSWQASDGNEYDIESLLAVELEQSLPESACGGTHRLIGMSMALNKRRAEGRPINGLWLRANQKLDEAIQLARQNQNPDGSYSSAYFHRPGWTRDLGETLGTTGHVLEFLAFAASDETLQEPWVERGVRRLCAVLEDCQDVDLECGVLYHALHGLAEYQTRMIQMSEPQN
ncbi:MAG: ADP-ribosylation factor-directed GTPase activating protein isoform b [Pirellulales bacterium]|nr:ADP-ribosylation factor-directed GTPase activating protein isoform b [Pirellulales bacterium]